MESPVANWIVFYTLGGSKCSVKFFAPCRPSLTEVAERIARAWGAAGVVMPLDESDPDAGARVFLESNRIENVTCTPFIERRLIAR
jgi:hypothetical protein